MVLGAQIRTARVNSKWTQAELARRIGVSERTIASLERGAPGTQISTVFNAMRVLNIPIFGQDTSPRLAAERARREQFVAMLPGSVRETPDINTDF